MFLRVLVQRPIMQSAPEDPNCVHDVAAAFDVFVNLGLFLPTFQQNGDEYFNVHLKATIILV